MYTSLNFYLKSNYQSLACKLASLWFMLHFFKLLY